MRCEAKRLHMDYQGREAAYARLGGFVFAASQMEEIISFWRRERTLT